MENFNNVTWIKGKKITDRNKGGIYSLRRIPALEQPAWWISCLDGTFNKGQQCFWDEAQINEHFEILETSTDPAKASTQRDVR